MRISNQNYPPPNSVAVSLRPLIGLSLSIICLLALSSKVQAQGRARIEVRVDSPGSRVSPTLHGIFFEEISHAGEGGLYAEMIQNRGFEELRLPQGTHREGDFIVPPRTPHFMMKNNEASDWKMEWTLKSDWPAWSMQTSPNTGMYVSLTEEHPLNTATPHSMQVDLPQFKTGDTADLINEGFWGIAAKEGESYRCSFYLRTENPRQGSIGISILSSDGSPVASQLLKLSAGTVPEKSVSTTPGWKKYTCILKAFRTDAHARFALSFQSAGRYWVDFASLMPVETFMNRPNGLRKDLATLIADLKPAFIRWPGGCFVEGINIQSAPDWRRTIGPIENRPGTYSPWGYWTSDGFGYHEYLQYCEDIGAAALYVFNVGISCEFRSGTFVPDDSVGDYIQNALDAIEYAIGPVESKWGRVRAASGHPKPFPLKYVEVGNEQYGPRYANRYNRFYEAIKTKYPSIQIIASMGIADVNRYTLDSMRKVDIADEHAYKSAGWAMSHYDHFDKHTRGDWAMYVGEYATNSGVGAGNMTAALNDAVYIMAMEKNGDMVKMSSYAPLLVNVNDIDWPVNLINFDAARSFGRISYYAIKMLSESRADVNLATHTRIDPPVTKSPAFSGGIGLATWDTQTAYKDIEVTQDGKIVYKSDLVTRPDEWAQVRGQWSAGDSSLSQNNMGAQLFAMLKGRKFDRYTLTMKAKKLGGYNAFIVPFAVQDTNTCLRAHIGSWLNSHAVIERVSNGYDVMDLTEQKKLDKPIETGRWYEIKLEVGIDTVKCYLDGQLLMTYTESDKIFALAGKDEKTGEIVIKMVNGAAIPYQTSIDLRGIAGTKSTATLITLKSETGEEENSFSNPDRFKPVQSAVELSGTSFERTLPPYSISVLKIQPK